MIIIPLIECEAASGIGANSAQAWHDPPIFITSTLNRKAALQPNSHNSHHWPPIALATMAKDSKPTTHHPVEPLPNSLAQIYTHIHPLVVLSSFLYRFDSLVSDPVSTLLSSALPLAVLQTAYVAICLPSANDVERRPKGKKASGGKKIEEMGWGFKIVVRCLLPNIARQKPQIGRTRIKMFD